MQAIVKAVSAGISTDPGGEPKVLFHLVGWEHTRKTMRKGDEVPIEVFFFGDTPEFAEKWRKALQEYLKDPEGGKNFSLQSFGEIDERTYAALAAEQPSLADAREICLHFLSPLFFKPKNNMPKNTLESWLSMEQFIGFFERRLFSLFRVPITFGDLPRKTHLLPYYWKYENIPHESKTQPGKMQFINGTVGWLYVKGDCSVVWPLLLLGSELHAGTKISNSQGYYRILPKSPGWFAQFFPSTVRIRAALSEVIGEHESNAEDSAHKEMHPRDEAAFQKIIFDQLNRDDCNSHPDFALVSEKQDGSIRIEEKPGFHDQVVRKYLLKVIENFSQPFFYEGPTGLRMGVPRFIAVDSMRQAVSDGFLFVTELNIGDFFLSIRHDVLFSLLDRYIPDADRRLKSALCRFHSTFFPEGEKKHNQVFEVAKYDPLARMVTDLYLYDFDKQASEWDVRMIRYADNVIVMTRTREEAERVLEVAANYLSEVNRRLRKKKTAIRPIKDGSRSLGIGGNSRMRGFHEYAVVYDISNDRERNCVAKILAGFGFRIQKSVFECKLTRRGQGELTKQLDKLGLKSGFVKLYRLEFHARGAVIGEGGTESPDDGHAFIV